MRKLESIMLIDDNNIDLFINKKIINKFNKDLIITAFPSAKMALNFFKDFEFITNIKSLLLPDIILCDVNMPEMDGFQFLKELAKLKLPNNPLMDVYLLSSSTCPKDFKEAQNNVLCTGFMIKPLTIEKLEKIADFNYVNDIINIKQKYG